MHLSTFKAYAQNDLKAAHLSGSAAFFGLTDNGLCKIFVGKEFSVIGFGVGRETKREGEIVESKIQRNKSSQK